MICLITNIQSDQLFSNSETPPPTKLKVRLHDQVKECQGSKAGQYLLQTDLINNTHHWISKDGSKAIWWQKNLTEWIIGEATDIGTSQGGLIGPQGDDEMLHQIKVGWKFADSSGIKEAAPNEVVIQDLSQIDGEYLFEYCVDQ